MKKILLCLLLLFCLVGCTEDDIYIVPSSDDACIHVEIKGAIKYPGVYEVKSDAIMMDLINLAGGIINNANLDSINLASKLSDNQLVIIPSKDITSNLININKATIEELTTLEGIGTGKAESIIKYRNEVGLFTCIDDLKKVKGIGEALFEKIKAYITI